MELIIADCLDRVDGSMNVVKSMDDNSLLECRRILFEDVLGENIRSNDMWLVYEFDIIIKARNL